MSVYKLKRDLTDAAQKYKRLYKQFGKPDDRDLYERLSKIVTYLDDLGGGGVDSIIAGSNISISPVSGTGDVTINADSQTTVRTIDSYTATEGQSTFTITASAFDFIDVYLNGARLISSEYTISGFDVILSTAAELDDEIIVISYDSSTVIDVSSVLDNIGTVGNDLYLYYNY